LRPQSPGAHRRAEAPASGATRLPHPRRGPILPAQNQTYGNAINNRGVVAGTWAYGDNWQDPDRQALIWQESVPGAYSTLGGAISEAMDINDDGALAGWSRGSDGRTERALLDTAEAGLQDLDLLAAIPEPARWASLLALEPAAQAGAHHAGDSGAVRCARHDNAGRIVGTCAGAAAVREGSAADTLACLAPGRVGAGLSDNGNLVGHWNGQAFLRTHGRGHVVGTAALVPMRSPYGNARAFLYTDRLMHDLGTLGGTYGEASGINGAGAVVGQSALADSLTVHTFLYEHGAMRDLHVLTAMPVGWVMVFARDINDRRQVLARACHDEDCVDVRLDPVPPSGSRTVIVQPWPTPALYASSVPP
jgi:probable HAF family extracellular repeat protein